MTLSLLVLKETLKAFSFQGGSQNNILECVSIRIFHFLCNVFSSAKDPVPDQDLDRTEVCSKEVQAHVGQVSEGQDSLSASVLGSGRSL